MHSSGQVGSVLCRGKNFRGGAAGPRLLRMVLLVLLALAVVGGGGLAGGDLFDDDYRDCPHQTRLRDGQIADLSAARDAEEADEVVVSWAGTDPVTWGLGGNAYDTSLVLLLDDGGSDPHIQKLALARRKATFEGIRTGAEVTVQMAIVVDTADGDYLISDILEADIHQSLTKPEFKDDFRRRLDNAGNTEATGGVLYFVGYNENFTNYRAVAGESFVTLPATERLRIGLRHGGEDDDAREAVDFDAYRLRITDSDGDVVPEGDDVATVAAADVGRTQSGFTFPYSQLHLIVGRIISPDTTTRFSTVRINDNGEILAPIHDGGPRPPSDFFARPVGVPPTELAARPVSFIATAFPFSNDISVPYPDEFRDFPTDVLVSDETYTLTAWAVNEDGEVISPVQSLRVHPVDTVLAPFITGNFLNYLDATNGGVTTLHTTEFTILK